MMPGPRLTAAKKADLRRLWPFGWTQEALAAHLEISPATVRRVAAKLGLPPRSPGWGRPPLMTAALKQRLRDLWTDGAAVPAIAEELGVSCNTVWRHANEMGLPKRCTGAG